MNPTKESPTQDRGGAEVLAACAIKDTKHIIHGLTCPCRLLNEFYPPGRRKRDIDNMLASIKDGLDGCSQAVGVDNSVFNDCQLVKHKQIGGMVRLSVLPASCNAGGTP